MKIVNLRMHQVRKLKELVLEKGTLNTEALMLILDKKYIKENKEKMLFKYMDAQDDIKVMGRKLYTLNMLNSSEKYKEIEELVIPDTIVIVDNNITGFAMPLIENHINLGNYLNNESNSFKSKLDYLKQVGKIINKVERVEDESFRMNFGDLNEFNFIIDKNNIVRAVDLDSAYVGQDEPPNTAYYLLKNKYLYSMPDKYQYKNSGIIIPNNNSDLYCYNMILLNILSDENMYKKDLDIFYKYLAHLKDVGIDNELIKIFNSIYLPTENQNPVHLIKTIREDIKDDISYKVFKKEYKINE
ncbi:MAG: hypothetical protein J6K23_06435 [Bacilli bacterium]|nr:hypothetical protein [Bacilli bacterium]